MSKRQSEVNRFLGFYLCLGEEAKKIVSDQVRDAFRSDKPKRKSGKVGKPVTIPADSQIPQKK